MVIGLVSVARCTAGLSFERAPRREQNIARQCLPRDGMFWSPGGSRGTEQEQTINLIFRNSASQCKEMHTNRESTELKRSLSHAAPYESTVPSKRHSSQILSHGSPIKRRHSPTPAPAPFVSSVKFERILRATHCLFDALNEESNDQVLMPTLQQYIQSMATRPKSFF